MASRNKHTGAKRRPEASTNNTSSNSIYADIFLPISIFKSLDPNVSVEELTADPSLNSLSLAESNKMVHDLEVVIRNVAANQSAFVKQVHANRNIHTQLLSLFKATCLTETSVELPRKPMQLGLNQQECDPGAKNTNTPIVSSSELSPTSTSSKVEAKKLCELIDEQQKTPTNSAKASNQPNKKLAIDKNISRPIETCTNLTNLQESSNITPENSESCNSSQLSKIKQPLKKVLMEKNESESANVADQDKIQPSVLLPPEKVIPGDISTCENDAQTTLLSDINSTETAEKTENLLQLPDEINVEKNLFAHKNDSIYTALNIEKTVKQLDKPTSMSFEGNCLVIRLNCESKHTPIPIKSDGFSNDLTGQMKNALQQSQEISCSDNQGLGNIFPANVKTVTIIKPLPVENLSMDICSTEPNEIISSSSQEDPNSRQLQKENHKEPNLIGKTIQFLTEENTQKISELAKNRPVKNVTPEIKNVIIDINTTNIPSKTNNLTVNDIVKNIRNSQSTLPVNKSSAENLPLEAKNGNTVVLTDIKSTDSTKTETLSQQFLKVGDSQKRDSTVKNMVKKVNKSPSCSAGNSSPKTMKPKRIVSNTTDPLSEMIKKLPELFEEMNCKNGKKHPTNFKKSFKHSKSPRHLVQNPFASTTGNNNPNNLAQIGKASTAHISKGSEKSAQLTLHKLGPQLQSPKKVAKKMKRLQMNQVLAGNPTDNKSNGIKKSATEDHQVVTKKAQKNQPPQNVLMENPFANITADVLEKMDRPVDISDKCEESGDTPTDQMHLARKDTRKRQRKSGTQVGGELDPRQRNYFMQVLSHEYDPDKKRVLIIAAEDCNELEIVSSVSILRSAGVLVLIAGLSAARRIFGKFSVGITVNCTVADVQAYIFDAIILHADQKGVDVLCANSVLSKILLAHEKANKVFGISNFGALVLRANNLCMDRVLTCHPRCVEAVKGFFKRIDEKQDIVVDKQLVSSRSLGSAVSFAMTICEKLLGKPPLSRVAAEVLIKW